MITFENQNNIEVAAIDSSQCEIFPECVICVLLGSCKHDICTAENRADKREVFFLAAYDKRILNYKTK